MLGPCDAAAFAPLALPYHDHHRKFLTEDENQVEGSVVMLSEY